VYPGEHDAPINERFVKNTQRYAIPPAEVVSRVLRECEDIYDTVIGLFYPVRPYLEIVALCKEVYFNIDDISVASLIVAFGSLYFVFRCYQFSFSKEDPRQEEFQSYTKMFVRNMMDLIGLLPVLMAPTVDNFEALLLGVSAPEFLEIASEPSANNAVGILRSGDVEARVMLCAHIESGSCLPYSRLSSLAYHGERYTTGPQPKDQPVLVPLFNGQRPLSSSWSCIMHTRLRHRCTHAQARER
jgi:hypothetical protein